jgi:hypothetical protein
MPQITSLSSNFPTLKDSGITGSGKRAYYAMLSRNTSTVWHGAAFYDRSFRSVFNTGSTGASSVLGPSQIVYNHTSTYQHRESIWESVASTASPPNQSGTSNYVNSTNAAGEFGNAMIDAYSDGTINNIYGRQYGNGKHISNACAINSDHLNKRIVYILYNGNIFAVDRLYGSYNSCMENTGSFAVSSLNTNMQGSASYHRARKELTILNYVATGGSFNCFTYQNVDFDTYPDPYIALNRPGVTRVDATLSLASNWAVNNSESYYNLKPITTDNGNVYVSVFFTQNNFSLYRFTRSGTSAITGTYITNQSVTTSYGLDQAINYGQRQITSRDGTSVATFCPYYYYGCGVRCYMIDKTNNTYTAYGNADTSYGIQCMPYEDNGWVFYYAGNTYPASYNGGYMIGSYTRIPTGGHRSDTIVSGGYFPYFTIPNTTNYPGFTQVVDYVLLSDNVYGPK